MPAADAASEPSTPARQRRPVPTTSRGLHSDTDPDRETRWTPAGLLVLLLLVTAVQLPVGAVIHATSHGDLLVVDLFFFQPEFVLFACVLLMPLAHVLTRQKRRMRILESLSLGAVFALLALLLSTVLVHPQNANASSAQFLRSLTVGDGVRIAVADLIAVAGAVAVFPGLNRLLGAPGRRARQRMIARNAAARSGAGRRSSSRTARRP